MLIASFITPTNEVVKEISGLDQTHATNVMLQTIETANQVEQVGGDFVMYNPVVINGYKRYHLLHIWEDTSCV